jgi:hypothetical protein
MCVSVCGCAPGPTHAGRQGHARPHMETGAVSALLTVHWPCPGLLLFIILALHRPALYRLPVPWPWRLLLRFEMAHQGLYRASAIVSCFDATLYNNFPSTNCLTTSTVNLTRSEQQNRNSEFDKEPSNSSENSTIYICTYTARSYLKGQPEK